MPPLVQKKVQKEVIKMGQMLGKILRVRIWNRLWPRGRRWGTLWPVPAKAPGWDSAGWVWEGPRGWPPHGQERRLQTATEGHFLREKLSTPKSFLLGKCIKCFYVYSGYQG